MRKRKTCAQGSGLECLPLQTTTAFKACTHVVPACVRRLRSLPIQTSTAAIHKNAGKKSQGQQVKCMTAHRSKKKETSVQRARRTATRHAIESRMPPVLKSQILQKTAGSLVSHCWTQEMPLQTPSTPRTDIAIVSHCWTMAMQDFKPRKATTRDSCQPSSAISGQRRTP
jgi:hypothetical protein